MILILEHVLMSNSNVEVNQQAGAKPALRALLVFARPYWVMAAVAVASVLATSSLLLLASFGIRNLIDAGFGENRLHALDQAACLLAGGAVVFSAIAYLRDYTIARLAVRIIADVRQRMYDTLLGLSPGFFETAPAGDMLSRLVADVTLLHDFISSALFRWIRSLLAFTGALVLLIATSATLAAIVTVLCVLVVLPLLYIANGERRLSVAAQEGVGELSSFAEESINAIRTIQAFTHEPLDKRGFRLRLETGVSASLRCARRRALLVAVGFILGVTAFTFCLWFGVGEVAAHRRTAGELLSFLFYVALLATAGGTLLEVWGDFQRAAGAINRILEVLDQSPSIAAPAIPVPLANPVKGCIEFCGVSFHYPTRPDQPVLRDFTVSITAGETVAIVGQSGAGKSTILHLLTRFYDPNAGTIRLDGLDIRAAELADLRRKIGLVPQDPMIFSANAWENIRYGRPDATDKEVLEAAEASTAIEFLRCLPDGLDSFLGERGVRLSGGQRQRLALARVILKDPAIFMLDEATSALDAESEHLVQQALAQLSIGRTTLIVAHRLATVRRADRILVLEDGRLMANDTHHALLRKDGLYSRLAKQQCISDAA
jgi:ATP-binding cassette, subfamily B, bacterial